MNSSRNNTKLFCIFLLCIIFSLAVIFYQTKGMENGKSTPMENIFLSTMLPLQNITNGIGKNLSLFFSSFGKIKELNEENYKLKEEIGKLIKENNMLKEAIEQNKNLKELLDFKDSLDIETITSQLIGREPNSWFQSIIINSGNKNGIIKNMPVIDYKGLVGKVMVVSSYTAKVMLITDTESTVPALIRETRDCGIIYGTGTGCEMRYLNTEAEIKIGYTVETSGLGKIFPKGIPIGKITKIYPSYDRLFQTAEIEPYVNFGSIENILIIKNTPLEEFVIPE